MSLNWWRPGLRPLAEPQQRAAQLYFVWRDDNDNPLLPLIATIARGLAGALPDTGGPA
ncbi:MAG: LysR family transcriptional regulator [Bradyrhizobium sp.]|nr:LysR family transcriptional regulator [Bradyrhizobium sp.]